MIQKIENALLRTYLKAKLGLMKLGQEEDGMETLETVILIAIAVVIGGVLVTLLAGKNKDGESGLISDIFGGIRTKIKDAIGVEITTK